MVQRAVRGLQDEEAQAQPPGHGMAEASGSPIADRSTSPGRTTMSLFSTTQLQCPKCQQMTSREGVGSLNADRRPDLRQQILDGTFQIVECSHCGHTFRLEPDFNYV